MALIYAFITVCAIHLAGGTSPPKADSQKTWHEVRDPKRDLEKRNGRLYIRENYKK